MSRLYSSTMKARSSSLFILLVEVVLFLYLELKSLNQAKPSVITHFHLFVLVNQLISNFVKNKESK